VNHPITAPTNNEPFFPQNPQVILSHSQENLKLEVTHNHKERQSTISSSSIGYISHVPAENHDSHQR